VATDPDLRCVGQKTLRLWRRTGERFRALPASTLAVFHARYEVQLRLTKILADGGVPMIAGSDVTGASWEVPGASLHQEFDELARAGLTPVKVLQMTTVEAGRFLGLDDLGVVEPGAPADLVLLEGDPTTDVANLHRVTGVVRAGRHLARADLDSIRERVAAQRSVG
jgi:imidazolonepropionase-like amidohydrolase